MKAAEEDGMAAQTRLEVIDADAHVMESDYTWDYLEPSEQEYRPLLVSSPKDRSFEYRVVEDKVRGFRFRSFTEIEEFELSTQADRRMEEQQARREMDDVRLRLRHLDELGIDVQVLHNTMWIEKVAD